MTITTTKERVTPKLAEKWLHELNSDNRSMRSGVAEQYASDMRANRWTQCVAPIAFYADGNLADGQHRLWAVLDSETTQEFIILRGLDRASGLNIDVGLCRNIVDNGRISGADTGLSTSLLAAARACETGLCASRERLSNAAKVDLVARWREPCEWAIAHGGKTKNISNSAFHGALARAWLWEKDKERLAEFARIVLTGFSNGSEDSAAVAMRNYMIQNAGVASSSTMWRDTFMKFQNAIHHFMRRGKLTVIKGVKEEAYPLKQKRKEKQA